MLRYFSGVPIDEPEEEIVSAIAYEESDVDAMVAVLLEQQGNWRETSEVVDLGSGIRWLPRLRTGSRGLVHIHATPSVSSSWLKRMELAASAGYEIHVAAPHQLWHSVSTIKALDSIGVRTLVLQPSPDDTWKLASRHRSVIELVSKRKFVLDPDALREVGVRALNRAITASTSNEKGWRFEDFLCLLFGHVSFFEIFSRNYRNQTQEIDLILRDRRIGGSPITLVSAKNTSSPVESDALTSLRAKMSGRRGQCTLGFLCVAGAFTRSVPIDEIGNRLANSSVVLLDGNRLRELLEHAEDLDNEVERLIIEAALR